MSSTAGETPMWIQNFRIEVRGFHNRIAFEFSANPENGWKHSIMLPAPEPAGPARTVPSWMELRTRIQAAGNIPFKEVVLLGAWGYLSSLGNDLSLPFGTTEIKMVLGDEWRNAYNRRPIDTHDLQSNPWMVSAGGKQYALRPGAGDHVEMLLREQLGF